METITNKLNECMGVPNYQGVVSATINDTNNPPYILFQTSCISDCLGIGVRIYSGDKIKQVSLFHSISEHRFTPSIEINNQLKQYIELGHEERQQLLSGELISKRINTSDKNYICCTIAQLFSSLENGDHIEIVLHGGSNTSDWKLNSAFEDLNQWLSLYIRVKSLNHVDCNFIYLNSNSTYFAISSDGSNYTNQAGYNNALTSRSQTKPTQPSSPPNILLTNLENKPEERRCLVQ
ncbi:hypothetical protein L3V82_11390 [Thiotrichales bacterium 19S3-7]|nr:hypothetical protein [Thiotrichales bacterium 19S3-7]MCF6802817.1 hypothetical protein [Thiotrichales bacterium 19S3-11]